MVFVRQSRLLPRTRAVFGDSLLPTRRYNAVMIKTVEAVVDEQGTVRLAEHVELPCARRALVTILDEEPALLTPEPALLSERALAEDWNRPEEDAAWAHLQKDR